MSSQPAPHQARIAVVGCGGLGVPAAWTLVLGGARRLRLVDDDRVEESNLHRQVAYTEADLGRSKAEALADFLRTRVPGLAVEIVAERLDASNAARLLEGCDAVVEGSDDATCKFAVNDWAVVPADRPRVASIAAAIGRKGQVMVVEPGGACYRCLFEEPPPAERLFTCAVAGVLGSVTGQVGAMAARALLHALAGRQDAARSALVRLEPRGLLRTAVAPAVGCPCGRGPRP